MVKQVVDQNTALELGSKKTIKAPMIESVDVLVVGGGASGLACLKHLKNNIPELKAVLLESQHNLGGRVKAGLIGNQGDVHRQAGAEFGYQDLFETLDTLKVPYSKDDREPVAIYEQGKHCVFDEGKLKSADTLLDNRDPDIIRNDLFCEMKSYGRDISIDDFLSSQSAIFLSLKKESPKVAQIIHQSLIAEYACRSLKDMGIAVLADQAESIEERTHHNTLSGDVYRLKNGYNNLVASIGKGLETRTASTVQSIESVEDGQYLVCMRDADQLETYYIKAKHLVLAVPVPALAHISMPEGVDYKSAVSTQTKETFAQGEVVKVLFESEHPLLPEGKATLSCTESPIEVWQEKINESNYQYTLWIPGSAAVEFYKKTGIGEFKDMDVGHSATSQRSPAHAYVQDTLKGFFGEEALEGIERFSIIPWSLLKNAGHAYRTLKPTGNTFENLEQPEFVELGKNLYLAGADVYLATVPSAMQSGIATANKIISKIK